MPSEPIPTVRRTSPIVAHTLLAIGGVSSRRVLNAISSPDRPHGSVGTEREATKGDGVERFCERVRASKEAKPHASVRRTGGSGRLSVRERREIEVDPPEELGVDRDDDRAE